MGQQVNEGNGINTQGVERPRDESRDAESLEAYRPLGNTQGLRVLL